ncbi:MAG: radical SAM protein, partial [Pseudomonadota bacterium]
MPKATAALPYGPDHGFGAYIHWPYCTRICPYCDFNVYAAKTRNTAPLVNALCADITAHRTRLPEHPPLGSIYFGGGTPSLLDPGDIARLITACRDMLGLARNAEVTLEANPNTITPDRAAEWSAAGITRLSIGIQSLNEEALTFLGRDHSAET